MKENKKSPVILSIDGATKTGWAIYKNGKIVKHDTKKFRPSLLIEDYSDWLKEMIEKYNITQIVAEDTYRDHSRTRDQAFAVLNRMRGALESKAHDYRIPVEFEGVLRVKNYMIPLRGTHTRAEDKQRMINRITRYYGYTLKTENADDEADAIGIMITYLDGEGIPVLHPSGKKK